jgi:hypothetical protein
MGFGDRKEREDILAVIGERVKKGEMGFQTHDNSYQISNQIIHLWGATPGSSISILGSRWMSSISGFLDCRIF